MKNLHRLTSRVLPAALLLAVAACAVPHRDYSIAQIKKVDNLAELMDVQATVIDPWFAQIDALAGGKVTDAQWTGLRDAGTRLLATAARVVEFSDDDAGFERFNDEVAKGAAGLLDSVTDRDPKKAAASLRRMRKGCRDCHDEYR